MPKILFFLFSTALNLWAQSTGLPPPSPKNGTLKLQSILWGIAAAAKSARKPVALPLGVRTTDDGRLILFLVPESRKSPSSIDTKALLQIGGEVLASSDHFMRVAIPPESLEKAVDIPGVSFIRTPIRPQIQSVMSEGAEKINALRNHDRGVRGQGVKVAVIDIGFSGGDKRSGDLPTTVMLKDFTRTTTSNTTFFTGTEVHGTACAEVVYDVAPSAELYLLKIDDLVDFESAADYCIKESIGVVSYSASWLDTGFGDGQGIACEIVNSAADKGVLWVNSAGNYSKSQYTGLWKDGNSNQWHDFYSEEDEVEYLKNVKTGDEIEIILTWNDWPISDQDYDLFLYRLNSGVVEKLAESTSYQGSDTSQPNWVKAPVEHITYTVSAEGIYGFGVWKEKGARTEIIKVWSKNHDLEKPTALVGTIGAPADARGAVGVGAIDQRNWSSGTIEAFSSQGPTVV